MNYFAERLTQLRNDKNLSRKQLADLLNVSPRLIGYWENNQRECDFDMLIKLADFFDVSIDFILGRTDY